MKFYDSIYKRITFALFMNLKKNKTTFQDLWDLENSKKNHKIDVSYKKNVIDITSYIK
jgi:hypothetical protein